MKLFKKIKENLDVSVVVIPLVLVLIVGIIIMCLPSQSLNAINVIRDFLGNKIGFYYILAGIGALIVALVMAFSRIGKIKIGNCDKPQYNNLTWGILIFTSTMAADILFYALHEWSLYYGANVLDTSNTGDVAQNILWSSTYPLFHWGAVPWSFYLILAVVYAFMFYNMHRRDKQKISEACRPVLGKHADGLIGKGINIVSIFGFMCGTATTFSVATPLMTAAICDVFNIQQTKFITIAMLLIIFASYTIAVMLGSKGITRVAKLTTLFFVFMLCYFFVFGNPRFTIENGINAIGNMLQNFIRMVTWTDPGRFSNGEGATSGFPQDWTMFYWAYWIAWCVATPFFIAKISKGRTIKNIILGGGLAGLAGTYSSFIIFGNFGLYQQVSGNVDITALMNDGATPYQVIIEIIKNLPLGNVALIVLVITMIGLYATTFDAITDVMSSFSYKKLDIDKEPNKLVKLYWAIVFIILPIALVFSEGTATVLQSVSIIGAFPISICVILTIISFFKSVKEYEKTKKPNDIVSDKENKT